MDRTFWPVGQGAFYSETFSCSCGKRKKCFDFTMVYDCGTMSNQQHVEQSAKDLLNAINPTKIDVLFISHLHSDHISYVQDIIDKVTIIILPFLSDAVLAESYLGNYLEHMQFDNPAIKLIESLYSEEREKRTIIHIRPAEGSEPDEFKGESGIINLSDIDNLKKRGPLSSGMRLRFSDWEYIPCNYPNSNSEDLLKDIKTNYPNLYNAFLKRDWSTVQSEINKITILKIEQIYKKHSCHSNKSSMLVLSRPVNATKKAVATCLYTGDFTFNSKQTTFVKTFYKKYWKQIGTMQSPHHGADKENPPALHDASRTCIACYGTSNNYKHPGKQALINIALSRGKARLVTENVNTKFVQTIIL